MSTSYTGTQSVVRVLRLLKLFNGEQREWTLNELVEASQLNKTTVFRMLTALESEKMIERTVQGNYQLGIEMIALGGRAVRDNDLRTVAQPILESLVEQINERMTLEQLIMETDGCYAMMITHEVNSNYLIRINQEIGARLPLHATSTGKAMLAFMPEEDREIALQQRFGAFTEKTMIDPQKLAAELNTIRQRGYATAIGELEQGLMAAGTPIFNYAGEPVAAISVEGPDMRIDERKLHDLASKMLVAAAEISARLGYRKP